MAKCLVCLLGIILCPFLKGTSGVNETHVFSTSGENVRLPCNNALSNCTSTTWIYTRHSGTVGLIEGGKTKNDTERHERLSVGSDCSLNIKKVTQEDYGSYTCRQFVNGQQQGTDARVYMHFLHVSSSSSQSEIRPGSSVTLSCQLYSDNNFPCDTLVRTEELQLIWVNQTGVSVMTDSRYMISFSPTHCISTLTTTLLNEDHNREWRCQVTQRNQRKTSFTVKYSAQADMTPVIPVHTTNSEDPSNTNTPENRTKAIVFSAVVAALAMLVVVFWLIYKKRADNKRGTCSSVVKDVNEHKGTYETINMSIPSTPKAIEQTDDVTYSEVTTSCKEQVQMDNEHSTDTVTYAAIRGTEYTPDGLYASVKKIKINTPHK